MLKKLVFLELALMLVMASLFSQPTFAGTGEDPDYQANTTQEPEVHRTSWGALKAVYRGNTPLPYTSARAESTAALRKPPVQPNSIGTPPNFVRNELWYSLNRAWLNQPNDPNGPGGNGTKSNWAWLSMAADANGNGLRYALDRNQTCVSNDIPPVCGCCPINQKDLMKAPLNTVEYWVGYLSANSYAVRDGIGRGTQCVSYVAMVLYRATGGSYKLTWDWSSRDPAKTPYASAINAQPGDIVFYNYVGNDGKRRQHIGICARNYGSGITVVDSNYLGYEMIGRHDVSSAAIGNTWKMISGAGIWR